MLLLILHKLGINLRPFNWMTVTMFLCLISIHAKLIDFHLNLRIFSRKKSDVWRVARTGCWRCHHEEGREIAIPHCPSVRLQRGLPSQGSYKFLGWVIQLQLECGFFLTYEANESYNSMSLTFFASVVRRGADRLSQWYGQSWLLQTVGGKKQEIFIPLNWHVKDILYGCFSWKQ